MGTSQISGEYRPVQNSRRGEFIAWGATLLVGFAWLVLYRNNQVILRAIPFLAVLLLFAALSISLGNWMDRQTIMRLDVSEVAFKNGLRNVRLRWDKIEQARVVPTRWGSKVQVFGEKAFFEFRTYGEVALSGNFTGRLGFEQGEKIMDQIIVSAGLQIVENEGEEYHYACP